MKATTALKIALVLAIAALLSGVTSAQCSGAGYSHRYSEHSYVAAPRYREVIVIGHGGGHGHGYRQAPVHYPRHWGR